ncbi:hypothetical protein FGO68_gene17749 [Halteria grandinella]|uniref:Uncharacterized protein n=1 Tax=Halteria grandinella TaxID=5974 RepID=A0A8J8NV96_HALGN|nr:hypothetical protein FGO68_gene17749 [Halteria grandinella]
MSDRVQGIGKIKSKYLIFEMFANAYCFREDVIPYFFTSAQTYRRLFIRNLDLFSITYPFMKPVKVWSPFDIILNLRPLPLKLAIDPQFTITHENIEELEQISQHIILMIPSMSILLREGDEKLIEKIGQWKPKKLSILFEDSGVDFSLIPASVSCLKIYGKPTQSKGTKKLSIQNLKIHTSDHLCMINSVGKQLVPTKRLKWILGTKGWQLSDQALKDIPSTVRIELYVDIMTPGQLQIIDKYPNIKLTAKHCQYQQFDPAVNSTILTHLLPFKLYLDDAVYDCNLNAFLEHPHPVKYIQFDDRDLLQIRLKNVNVLNDNTKELIFEKVSTRRIPLIATIINNCKGVINVRFNHIEGPQMSVNDQDRPYRYPSDNPQKIFDRFYDIWKQIADYYCEHFANEKCLPQFQPFKKHTAEQRITNSQHEALYGSETHIQVSFSLLVNKQVNDFEAYQPLFYRTMRHNFVVVTQSVKERVISYSSSLNSKEKHYSNTVKKKQEVQTYEDGLIIGERYQSQDNYINFKSGAKSLISFSTALFSLQPHLFKPTPLGKLYEDERFNDFIRIYNHFGANYVAKCGGQQKLSVYECSEYLQPILKAIYLSKTTFSSFADCTFFSSKVTAYLIMDFQILTYTTRKENNNQAVLSDTKSIVQRYIMKLCTLESSGTMLVDFMRSMGTVLLRKEVPDLALKELANRVRQLQSTVDHFDYIKEWLVLA